MKNEHEDKLDKQITFVAKHYRKDALDVDQAWKKFAETKGIRRKRFLYNWKAVAAVVLVCVGISTLYFMNNEKEEWLVVTTEPGQVKNVFLPDSSLVVMAGNSVIRYDLIAFGKGSRDVEMEGKIFFQVKRKEDSPFSVATGTTVVRVLGTSFQLNEKDGETRLYVNTGKVAFSRKEGGDELILTEGMSAVHKADEEKPVIDKTDNANVLSWQTKELHFNNTPLTDVIRDLSDYFNVTIKNRAGDEDKRLTTSFNKRSLEETLLIINQTLDVHLIVEPGK